MLGPKQEAQPCRRFRDNEVRLQLHALAYDLATFLRCIELPDPTSRWSGLMHRLLWQSQVQHQ